VAYFQSSKEAGRASPVKQGVERVLTGADEKLKYVNFSHV
jgi:hypothetical protein